MNGLTSLEYGILEHALELWWEAWDESPFNIQEVHRQDYERVKRKLISLREAQLRV